MAKKSHCVSHSADVNKQHKFITNHFHWLKSYKFVKRGNKIIKYIKNLKNQT